MKELFKDFFTLQNGRWTTIFENVDFAWQILPAIENYIFEAQKKLPLQKHTFEHCTIGENVFIDENVSIEPYVVIKGPALIGKNVIIRQGAYLKENCIIGDNCFLGHASELKNCFLFNTVEVPHFNYVGDSILGYKTHLGAGVILSNVRLDKKNISIHSDTAKIDTGLQKLGSILGEHVEVGCNSVLNPGTIIGTNSVVYPLSVVKGLYPAKSIIKNTDAIL